jgi:hypothetical protein
MATVTFRRFEATAIAEKLERDHNESQTQRYTPAMESRINMLEHDLYAIKSGFDTRVTELETNVRAMVASLKDLNGKLK